MPVYKITKQYTIASQNKIEARQKFTQLVQQGKEDELLEFISIKEVQEETNGLLKSVRRQLTGK